MRNKFGFTKDELKDIIVEKLTEFLESGMIEDYFDEDKIFLSSAYYIKFEFEDYDSEGDSISVKLIERTGDYRIGDLTSECFEVWVEDGIDKTDVDNFVEKVFGYED